ncbi:hypothetical protein A2V56_05180 [Candidatus Woesebacteria bacterium RBG_19FT_COMBO_42_9]|uniref:Uncharacterized protein n=1 Tax=Candidatus Woesebacteria bacterium RBG_16_42_24 TaxID=1802485 RepID=A0A1F7XLE7_9BACT|nr:MAG: hypothetical protein A2V97_03960 [Candidatus Woesebacteria bacterium RBG_16_42_24]OGM17275.1 MAG: hypothetical protein A2V56_05180 [Candidatus Woesebacteria bacterium RBG_19FT_COMBO_42_9]OGM67999.1 MAG: hypothetical protein A2985_00835 [Candidatus Woesebacteria bacterium RIFCSPLOWO2_01_FULL_43_11]
MAEETITPSPYANPEIQVNGYPVSIEVAPPGAKIPVLHRIKDAAHYVGPGEFDILVDFRDTFVRNGMWNSYVPKERQWNAFNLPEGITVLGFIDPDIKEATNEMEWIAQRDFYENDKDCERYYILNKTIFGKISRWSRPRTKSGNLEFIGLIRAGVVASEMLGISVEEQVLIQTKRLPLIGQSQGDIAIGLTPHNLETLSRLKEKHWVFADVAGATLASIIANVRYLIHIGIRPEKVSIWNAVLSHKGGLFGLQALRELGIDAQIVAGGYSPRLNKDYYLETDYGSASVGDAGNALDRFLPEDLRLLAFNK